MAWTDTVHLFKGHGVYNATLPTKTDGQTEALQLDSRGRLIVSVGADTVLTSTTAGTTWVDQLTATHKNAIVASSKALLFAQFQSTYATGGWIQLFNLAAHASLSTGVTVPTMVPIPIAAYGTVNIELPRGRAFSSGIVWAYSSTALVWTEVAAATVVVSAEYV